MGKGEEWRKRLGNGEVVEGGLGERQGDNKGEEGEVYG